MKFFIFFSAYSFAFLYKFKNSITSNFSFGKTSSIPKWTISPLSIFVGFALAISISLYTQRESKDKIIEFVLFAISRESAVFPEAVVPIIANSFIFYSTLLFVL